MTFPRIRTPGPCALDLLPTGDLQATLYTQLGDIDFDPDALLPTRLTINLAPGATYPKVHYAPHAQTGAQGGAAIVIKGSQDANGQWSKVRTLQAYFGAVLWLEDVELIADAGPNNGLDIAFGATVYLNRVRWGQCGSAHLNLIGGGSSALMQGPCSIVGTAAYHIVTQGGSFFRYGQPIDLQCNLNCSPLILATGPSLINFQGAAFVLNGHTITGTRVTSSSAAEVLQPTGGF